MKKLSRRKRSTVSNRSDFLLSVSIVYILLFTALMITVPKLANAGVSDIHSNQLESDFLKTLTVVGQGELTWLGFSIYQAVLWTGNGKFQGIEQSKPIAFAITYQKNIEANALAERTVEEWERLNIFGHQTRKLWGQRLAKIWPNFKTDDNITTIVTPDSKTHLKPHFNGAGLSIY